MRLGQGPLRIRIEAEGSEADELIARARVSGLVLAAPGETAELVARPSDLVRGAAGAGAGVREGSPSALSPRELEILDYLVDGWSNAEIASALGIGVRTVRFHLGNIYEGLGVSRRGEAVREAVNLGLVRFDA